MTVPAIRPAAVAGLFYPGESGRLAAEVNELLLTARQLHGSVSPATPPKALVVPHAGYVYSGAIAASAYALLANARDTVRRVVLAGPAHRVAFQGIAIPAASSFATPLGIVRLDHDTLSRLRADGSVVVSAAAHEQEHALEVQLPFLQSMFGSFELLPLVVGMTTAELVADVLDRSWGGPETLIVISTDLSHYHAYEEAQTIDRQTAAQINACRPCIDHEGACGATPLNGLLLCARAHGLKVHQIDLRNSGDTAGDHRRVVGYGAFAFYEPEADRHGALQH